MIAKIEQDQLEWLTQLTNRSFEQTQFLFDLCEGDFLHLCKLEEKIKNLHFTQCPNTKADIQNILSTKNTKNWFNLFQYSCYHSQLVKKELPMKRFV